MDNQQYTKMVEDIAFIKSKVESLPDLHKQVDDNAKDISRLKGAQGALVFFCASVIPLLISIFSYVAWKKTA